MATVYAKNNKDAIAKAIELRDGERYESSGWKLFGRVLSCEEEYRKLMGTLERIEKAHTLADIVENAPDPNWNDTALAVLVVCGENNFKRIHESCLIKMALAVQKMEKEAGMVRYFEEYCRNLYEDYKSRAKEIKHPDILEFIKDYEKYYQIGG